jgi:uncharacterized protein (TIGR02186 family)
VRRALLAFLLIAGGAAFASAARAQPLVADLSSHLIAITTGFTGTEVVLFGAVEQPGDVVVVVRGPEGPVTVRRKERLLGLWANGSSVTFTGVPSFYHVAASRPLEDIASRDQLARQRIGIEQLSLGAAGTVSDTARAIFQAALLREKQAAGLFPIVPGRVLFVGRQLFRTNVTLPPDVPTGAYQVSVYLFRNGQVAGAQTTPLLVSQSGVSAEIQDFAYRRSLLYGLVAVTLAVVAGWLGSILLRRV